MVTKPKPNPTTKGKKVKKDEQQMGSQENMKQEPQSYYSHSTLVFYDDERILMIPMIFGDMEWPLSEMPQIVDQNQVPLPTSWVGADSMNGVMEVCEPSNFVNDNQMGNSHSDEHQDQLVNNMDYCSDDTPIFLGDSGEEYLIESLTIDDFFPDPAEEWSLPQLPKIAATNEMKAKCAFQLLGKDQLLKNTDYCPYDTSAFSGDSDEGYFIDSSTIDDYMDKLFPDLPGQWPLPQMPQIAATYESQVSFPSF
ncbi:NAC domain-containing protein 89 [Prunus yedoensis var. nudiflora]|uniref:NAC domain-containing protein 89 n=1 Tax=Prunus yedoensis var. nudiflora TaxID=2094558 RepID=A0A314V2F8_PRUYE|nr:NAC domain-containing protein 89 [Prunus yedoensis var. nudiflora]